jgi:hypothetical protein
MLSFPADEEKTTTCARMNERKERDKSFLKSDLYRGIKQNKKHQVKKYMKKSLR